MATLLIQKHCIYFFFLFSFIPSFGQEMIIYDVPSERTTLLHALLPHSADEPVQCVVEGFRLLFAHLAAGVGPGHPLRNPGCLRLQCQAFFREADNYFPLVIRRPFACHQPLLFHPLEQGRDRIGVEHQPLRDIVYRLSVLFPEYHHHQVLGVGESQRLQVLPVSLRDKPAYRVEPEAQLVVKPERVRSHFI